MDDAILDKGLGPIGDLPLPQDLSDYVVPEFYRGGLRDFSVEESWEDGDRVVKGASRLVSWKAECLVCALRGAGVYQVPPDPLPPTCYPFVIPKSLEKVSLILIDWWLSHAPNLSGGRWQLSILGGCLFNQQTSPRLAPNVPPVSRFEL